MSLYRNDCAHCPQITSDTGCDTSKCIQVKKYEVKGEGDKRCVIWEEDLDIVVLYEHEVRELAKALGIIP